MVAAVVPAAIVVCAIAYQFFDATRRSELAALDRNADVLRTRLDVLVIGAARTATTLASFGSFAREDAGECRRDAASMLDRYRSYSGFIVLKGGTPWCEAHKPGAPSFADLGLDLTHADGSAASVRPTVLADGRFALAVAAPSVEPETAGVGVVLLIDNAYLADVLADFRSLPSSVAALADGAGRIVVPPSGQARAAIWPAEPLVPGDDRAVTAAAADGKRSVYTVAKLPSVDLWLLTFQRESDLLGGPLRQFAVTALAPLVTILAAALAIWIGLHGSVLRWLSSLLTATRAYTAGNLTTRIDDAAAAPREFSELAGAFNAMADGMMERTRDLEHAVAARNSYIREIHHRVKNNLQVIGSLLALQKRELGLEERAILRFPEDRINALSAAYRASYAVSELGHVPIGHVVREVAHRLQAGADGGQASFAYDFTGEELEIDLDTSVSIAMLLAEILPAYADAAIRSGAVVFIALDASPQTLRLEIRGSERTERLSGPLSRRFVQAYLRQLGATLDEHTPGRTAIEAPFPAIAARASGLHP
ncbi:sensor histidine kinase [Labrys wisconsinensis]|uniref:histidine kinase n=1 Tax=Labrys wisconsinensis TaxID=425677 RepID=A0ABU0J0P4_9HYPH|nr:histidine kinase dimerization/phosphoacceptor domain -containing protein [Labrys wisconsinensis]MDQ0467190.1 two-component sensor histidine kinase [Labrys wisconsinensis]